MSDAPATILLIEDEFLIRDYVGDCLEDAGFSVLRAGDGATALRYFEAGHRIDLVFTDITLPGDLDGFAIAKRIRARHPALPIVLTSGGHNAGMAKGQCPDEPFYSKPYDIGQLISFLRKLLAESGAKPART